jgi:hypothetical protein
MIITTRRQSEAKNTKHKTQHTAHTQHTHHNTPQHPARRPEASQENAGASGERLSTTRNIIQS